MVTEESPERPWIIQRVRSKEYDSDTNILAHSVLTIPNFANDEEIQDLIAAGERQLAGQHRQGLPRYRFFIGGRQKTALNLRLRLLGLIEAQMPDLAQAIFGQKSDLASMNVRFSSDEPAVNIYNWGGYFQPHTDNEAISFLVPLSPEGAFEGGGTAFWADTHIDRSGSGENGSKGKGKARELPHSHVVNPPAGTAIIFGGKVTHAGLPVVSGTRHLFVMSFTLRPRKENDDCGSGRNYITVSHSDDVETLPDGDTDGLADFADFFGD